MSIRKNLMDRQELLEIVRVVKRAVEERAHVIDDKFEYFKSATTANKTDARYDR